MNFNVHSRLQGEHAFLGASKYHWINYDSDKLAFSFSNYLATERGTRLHALACECIKLGIKLQKTKKTLNMYVNDAIGFKMIPEVVLYYSDNCFGTTDAISFKKDKMQLRIFDYKSGVTPASINQLYIYAALFCLEYDYKPHEINSELRIYQNDDIYIEIADPDKVLHIMDKIITFDKQIEKMKVGGIYNE